MTLQMILIGKVQYKYASPSAQSFINSLLEPQPQKRLGKSIEDMKRHSVRLLNGSHTQWLADMPWDNICNSSTPSPLIRINKSVDPTSFCSHYKEDIVESGDNPQLHNAVFLQELNRL